MPRATAEGPTAAGGRPLAEVYRRFGAEAASRSPLTSSVAVALAGSEVALGAIATAPARRRQPAVVLAALHELALAGRAPALAAAYAANDGPAAARAAVDTLLRVPDGTLATRRPVRTLATARCAVLYTLIAEAAHRVGAGRIGLVDVAGSTGVNSVVDRVGIRYSDGRFLGDPASPLQLSATVVGGRAVPGRSVPEVAARIVVDEDPLDLTDDADVRWLRACLDPEQATALDPAIAVAAATPTPALRGDVLTTLPSAIGRVPADAVPVVMTTWALSGLPPASRGRFRQLLDEAAGSRPIVWVSAEGVGVAPGVPTLGDRPASGHSILGITVLDGSDRPADAVGRCWSRGRLLAWLADD